METSVHLNERKIKLAMKLALLVWLYSESAKSDQGWYIRQGL